MLRNLSTKAVCIELEHHAQDLEATFEENQKTIEEQSRQLQEVQEKVLFFFFFVVVVVVCLFLVEDLHINCLKANQLDAMHNRDQAMLKSLQITLQHSTVFKNL